MSAIKRIAVAMVAAVCACPAQTFGGRADDKTVIWSPPEIGWLDNMPQATVPKEMIGALRVANVPIVLEETNLTDAQKRFGGTIGSSGDAGESLAWICLDGNDKDGTWILWLFSGEIDGPAIGGFQWMRLSASERPDRRCSRLPKNKGGVELPIALHLGMTEVEVQKVLGQPTVTRDKTSFYDHEHKTVIRNEDCTVSNDVAIVFREGAVWAIEAAKTTGN